MIVLEKNKINFEYINNIIYDYRLYIIIGKKYNVE